MELMIPMIRLFTSITVLCGTNNILQNISHIQTTFRLNVRIILQTTISPTENYYGSKYCYAFDVIVILV